MDSVHSFNGNEGSGENVMINLRASPNDNDAKQFVNWLKQMFIATRQSETTMAVVLNFYQNGYWTQWMHHDVPLIVWLIWSTCFEFFTWNICRVHRIRIGWKFFIWITNCLKICFFDGETKKTQKIVLVRWLIVAHLMHLIIIESIHFDSLSAWTLGSLNITYDAISHNWILVWHQLTFYLTRTSCLKLTIAINAFRIQKYYFIAFQLNVTFDAVCQAAWAPNMRWLRTPIIGIFKPLHFHTTASYLPQPFSTRDNVLPLRKFCFPHND